LTKKMLKGGQRTKRSASIQGKSAFQATDAIRKRICQVAVIKCQTRSRVGSKGERKGTRIKMVLSSKGRWKKKNLRHLGIQGLA